MLSIVMCARNMERTLPKVLELLVRREPRAEIVLVDDGSTDSTPEIMNDWAGKCGRIRIVRSEENIGLLKARKLGWEHTHGDHIAFMDADDYITAGYYSGLAKLCPEGGFSMGRAVKFGIGVRRPPYYGSSPYDWYLNGGEMRDRSQMTYIWNKVFSRSLTEKMFIDWDVPYMVHLEDTVFMSKAFRYCTEVVFGDEGAYLQPFPSMVDVPMDREVRIPLYSIAYGLMREYMDHADVIKALRVRWTWDGLSDKGDVSEYLDKDCF